MMTHKEKAQELIAKFFGYVNWGIEDSDYIARENAKQCAIICVEQIMEELKDVLEITASSFVREEISQYNKVIEHIKNS